VFGTNEGFLRNVPLTNFDVPPANFEADSYKKMALANGQTASGLLDDRASTPEIIFSDPIDLRTSVLAAILPDTLAIDPRIGGALRSQNIEVYEYVWTSSSRPAENHFVVRNLIQTVYKNQGWL
jgi:hypothetical protein